MGDRRLEFRQGLFLDLDGTLADSFSAMRSVYRRFLERYGRSGSEIEFDQFNGPPLPEIVSQLACRHAIDRPLEELIADYELLVEEVYLTVYPHDGAAELLELARSMDVRIGIVTSNLATLAQSWLRMTALGTFVDVIVGKEDVDRGKPDPEPYRIALERTGCLASNSLAVEDSIVGASSAIGAGLSTFLVGQSVEHVPDGLTGTVSSLREVGEVLARRMPTWPERAAKP